MSEISEIKGIQLRLAMLEKDCPYCAKGLTTGPPDYLPSSAICPQCQGTGKVPLLEGVRGKCTLCSGTGEPTNDPMLPSIGVCDSCQGRGWVPSKDPFKYLQAADKVILAQHEHREGRVKERIAIHIWEGELATLQALEKALNVGGLDAHN